MRRTTGVKFPRARRFYRNAETFVVQIFAARQERSEKFTSGEKSAEAPGITNPARVPCSLPMERTRTIVWNVTGRWMITRSCFLVVAIQSRERASAIFVRQRRISILRSGRFENVSARRRSSRERKRFLRCYDGRSTSIPDKRIRVSVRGTAN